MEYYLINKGIFGLENVSEQTQNLATIILKVRQTLFKKKNVSIELRVFFLGKV